MAKPATSSDNFSKRTKVIKIRVNDDEHRHILATAGNQPLACYIRNLILCTNKNKSSFSQQKKRSERDAKLIRQLSLIGNNLNQIARYINSNQKYDQSIDQILIAMRLYAIWEQLNDL